MNILFLRGFNNYFNRTIRKYSTLDEYRNKAINTIDYSQVNFNPNDGVATELIVGGPTQLTSDGKPLDWDKTGTPDYAICYEGNEIISRWFVLESERTREGQYRMALKRDVIVDNIDDVITAPIFIEKGPINSVDNPLLFNKENMTYNQIKEQEYLLKDATGVPWIIGYVAKNAPEDNQEINALISNMLENTLDPADLPWEFDLNNDVILNGGIDLKIQLALGNNYSSFNGATRQGSVSYQGWKMQYLYKDAVSSMLYEDASTSSWNASWTFYTNPNPPAGLDVPKFVYAKYSAASPNYNDVNTVNNKMANFAGDVKTQLMQQLQTDFSEAVSGIEQYRGKIIYDKETEKYYRITFQSISGGTEWSDYNPGDSIKQAIADFGWSGGDYSKAGNNVFLFTRGASLKPVYTEITNQSITLMLQKGGTAASRAVVNNAVFDIFALPYGEINIIDGNDVEFKTTAESSIAIARAIATTLTDSAVYDLQLLPYCPIKEIRDYYETSGYIDLGDFDSKYWATAEQTGESIENPKKTTVLFWATNASGTINIPLTLEVPKNPLELKIFNETTVSRLCSPNYAGMFEFSLAKNGGIDYINIDYNYRPYSPYIHANPNFKNLYGTDWNDARGLICGGDFTISSVSSAWQNYQVQNKNYQVIFDRQIQNMDVNNAIALEQQQFNAVAGTLTGGIAGGVGGAIAGSKAGPYGAIAGAVVGGIAGIGLSATGASLDREWLLRQQQENKSYAIDMFGYQLGNIQALPYSLSRTDSLTENNKLWPFLEIYTCKDEEKEALRNKLKYNGMTVMAVGNIFSNLDLNSQEKVYFQGQLIRIDEFKDDSHVLNEIYAELKKGVYFIGSEININLGGNYVSTTSNE